jgi:hypothetical protein
MSRVLGKYKHIDGFQTKWTSSLSALTLVSKQIYTETISYLYLNTTFVFDAPRRMSNFIQSVPAGNLAYVTKLILHYSTYGDPRYNSTFQEKHIKSWMVACKTASKSLVNLQKLEIFLRQNGTFSYFSLRDPSLQPLLQFRQLSSRRATSRPDRLTSVAEISNGLSTVVVHFSTRYTRGWDEQRYREHVCSKLHHLHGMAISRAILNLDEKDGLDDAKESIMQDARWMFRLASG